MTNQPSIRAPRVPFVVLAALALQLCGGCGEGTGVGTAPPSRPYDYCSGTPPDATCYAAKRDPSSANVALARAIADRYIAVHPIETLQWNWEPAVQMFGFTELYRVTGDVRYQQYYKDWIDANIARGYAIHSSDTCVPALIAAILYTQLGDERYRKVVDDALDYLDHRALRTEQGGINHLGDSDILGVTLWLDSLFMFGNLLTRWGEFTNDAARLDMIGTQFEIFTTLLQAPGGLYVHAYGYKPKVDTDIYWGRGNGWVTAAGYDYLRARLCRGERDPFVQQALQRQVSAIIALQDEPTGMWWTVLNRPGETYLETSAGALFAYGMARAYRYGFLGADVLPVIATAMNGVRSKIVMDDHGRPLVTGVSLGTSAGTFEYYKSIPVADDVAYGVGVVLLSLIETSGLPLGQ
jgi:unsaturated rhamnogalacturonyl hydrolase